MLNYIISFVYTIWDMTKNKHTTFRIDPEIKEAFKKETYLAGVDMTDAIESFMVNFVNIKRHERREKNNQS
jgi:hypothetical protein